MIVSAKSRARASARSAFTLIELLASMVAASVLLASLAGTIIVSTHLLETPLASSNAWADREVADRIASDLRYANFVDESPAQGFGLTKPNVTSGVVETINFTSNQNGLSRQVGANPTAVLDASSPSLVFSTDGYSAPVNPPGTAAIRVRSSSSVVTNSPVSSLSVDYPPGSVNGDVIIMAVSARSPNSISLSPSGWSILYFLGNSNLRLAVAYREFDDLQIDQTQVSFGGEVATAAIAMIALENAALSSSANWANADGGLALDFLEATHPQPLEPSTGTLPQHLNLQIFSANGDPWATGGKTLGVASYHDVIQATAGSHSIGVISRNGPPSTLSTTPRLWHRESGRWLRTGLRVGGEL